MTHSLLWILPWLLSAFIGSECVRYSRFNIAISFTNSTKKLSTSVFNLSVADYCVGGLPSVDDGTFGYHRVYQGDLVRFKWHSMQIGNKSLDSGCFLSTSARARNSSWIALIMEDKPKTRCLQFAPLNYTTSLAGAIAILFLHDAQSAFDFSATEASFSSSSSPSSPLRHKLDWRQGRGIRAVASVPPLLVSLPMDMFPDLPTQLAVASTFPQVAVTGDIELFAEPPSLPTTVTTSDLSSSLLLLLIVCVLFLLLGVLLIPARLGICFWQRLCFLSLVHSSKSRRSRKLNAATKKALKQLPVKCLNQVDPLISEGFDQCAICIEVFKPQDLIRSLPCRHMYHRACIDPWLLKHRSCPLCKQNILIACGLSLAEEDVTSCSATTSEVNSGFSLSVTSSASPSNSSISASLEGLFCPFLVLFSCRHPRRRRRHHYHNHFYRNFHHVRRPSSSLDEVSAPFEGRRVLGSASENSSSSITARSLPSDLFFHTAAISPSLLEKGTRFPAEEFDEEDDRGLTGRTVGRRGRRSLMCCCSCCGSRSIGVGKEAPIERPPSPQLTPPTCGTTLPSALIYAPPVAHSPAMLLYHLPHSMPLSQITMVTKAALPSYEQATATMSQAALVALPASQLAHSHQPIAGWSPHFTTDPRQQGVADPFDQPKRSYPGAKTSVVYAVLSTSGARMSANSGAPPAPILCSSNTKLPIFVDVNSPRVMGAFEGQRQRLFPSSSSPPLVQTRESSPPAYFLATVAANGKPVGTSLHPLRRVARFLATHLLSSSLTKQQHLRHRHYTSFFSGLKHYKQYYEPKHRLKPRLRRLHETSPSATAVGTTTTSVIRRHHRLRGYHRVGVLAKTLELNHEGVIMSSRSGAPAIAAGSSPVPSSHPPPLSRRTASQRCTPNSVSESSSEGTHHASLRHTRVHSVRVTVEPQEQYHAERDAASCEALHNAHLHDIGSENSIPRINSLSTPLKSSTSTDADVTVTAAAVAASLWRHSFVGSAPAIRSSIPRLTDILSSSSPSFSLPPL